MVDATSGDSKFKSRKFIVTTMGMSMLFILAAAAMIFDRPPDATSVMGIAAGMGAYNWANVKWNAAKNGSSN